MAHLPMLKSGLLLHGEQPTHLKVTSNVPVPPEEYSALAPGWPVSRKRPTSANTATGLVNLTRRFRRAKGEGGEKGVCV